MPEEFRLAANESINPLRGMAEELLVQAEAALTKVRATLKNRAAQSADLSDQARKSQGSARKLKKVSASATPKEQAAALAAQDKALGKLQSQLKDLRAALPK